MRIFFKKVDNINFYQWQWIDLRDNRTMNHWVNITRGFSGAQFGSNVPKLMSITMLVDE